MWLPPHTTQSAQNYGPCLHLSDSTPFRPKPCSNAPGPQPKFPRCCPNRQADQTAGSSSTRSKSGLRFLDYMSLMLLLLLLLLRYLPRCSVRPAAAHGLFASPPLPSGCLRCLEPRCHGGTKPPPSNGRCPRLRCRGLQQKAAGTAHHDASGAPTPARQQRAAPGQVQEPAPLQHCNRHVKHVDKQVSKLLGAAALLAAARGSKHMIALP